MIKVKCKLCKKEFDTYNSFVKNGRGKYCSKECYNKSLFKGDKAGYGSIHDWIRHYFGKPNKCENPKCLGVSKTFEWALSKGKKYSHKRENFMRLCKSCHVLYDGSNLKGWNKK